MLGYRGRPTDAVAAVFSCVWSATITDVFMPYAARLADGPTDHHQRPPTGQPLATDGRPTGGQ